MRDFLHQSLTVAHCNFIVFHIPYEGPVVAFNDARSFHEYGQKQVSDARRITRASTVCTTAVTRVVAITSSNAQDSSVRSTHVPSEALCACTSSNRLLGSFPSKYCSTVTDSVNVARE